MIMALFWMAKGRFPIRVRPRSRTAFTNSRGLWTMMHFPWTDKNFQAAAAVVGGHL